jgi:hypothetical protein
VSIAPGKEYVRGKAMFLTAPGNDVEARTGVTLGGAALDADGNWSGSWTPLPAPSEAGKFEVTVPRSSAAVLTFATR